MKKRTERRKSIRKKAPPRKPLIPPTAPSTVAAQKVREEFSPAFLRWLVTLTAATLILVFWSERAQTTFRGERWFALHPWIAAAGTVIEQGLQEFRGDTIDDGSLAAARASILIGLLLGFVVGPSLLLFAWRRSLEEQPSQRTTLKSTTLAFFIGGILLFPIVIPAIPLAIIQKQIAQSMRSAQAMNDAKDAMMADLNLISFDAQQFRARPFAMGGGGGSFFGYNIPVRLADSDHGTYLTVEVSEDNLVLKGISKQYPASNITVILGEGGHLRNWSFAGSF
jgi:hypothetical protein